MARLIGSLAVICVGAGGWQSALSHTSTLSTEQAEHVVAAG